MKIGVFDSGIGGEIVATALADAFKYARIITVNDRKHVPYGNREPEEIITLTNAAIQPLLSQNCEVIVIACNTATAASITWLRSTYPAQKFIGLEPMLKPAASLSKNRAIAVCATPATLSSQQYLSAKASYTDGVNVIEPDCSDWASLIENNTINRQHIANVVGECIKGGADVIVLGCTHYHWIKSEIEVEIDGKAIIIEPTEAVIARVSQLLEA